MNLPVQPLLAALTDGPNIPLDKPIVLIGRHQECDIQIPSRKISRRHCCIALVNDHLVIRDLGSTNGMKINGIRCQDKTLRPGDEISIASRRYTIEYNLPEGRQIIESTVQEDILSQPLLERAGLVRPRREQSRDGKPKAPPPRKDPFDNLDDD